MRVELITTGSELILGFTVNSHLNYIARQLANIGVRLDRQITVADERDEMRSAIAAIRSADTGRDSVPAAQGAASAGGSATTALGAASTGGSC